MLRARATPPSPSSARTRSLYGFSRPLLVVAALVVAAACGSSQTGPSVSAPAAGLGPLAVIDDPGGGALTALGGTGPIRIGERCVTLTSANGDVLLLVWRSAEVRWDEEDREITFTSTAVRDAKPITIRDGDIITVGGGSLDGDGGEPVTPNVVWLAAPQETCSADELWEVHSIQKEP